MPHVEEITLGTGRLRVSRRGAAVRIARPAPPPGCHDEREHFTVFVNEVDALISLLHSAKREAA